MSQLFTPLRIGTLEIPNRIIIAPMCQYAVEDGNAADWHMMHLGSLAASGAGLLILEVAAISPEGRISARDLGLYSDDNETALASVMTAIRSWSSMPVAIQLGHAGRKASSRSPFDGGTQLRPDQDGGWQTVAPSAIPHGADDVPPLALDQAGLDRVKADFAASAQRAVRAGFDGIELHMAHGYLLHQFLSPLSNHRDDAYGGSADNRRRFPVEVFEAVRDAVPEGYPVWVRVSATDWVEDGLDVPEIAALGHDLKALGCAAMHVSSGGLSTAQDIPVGPGYQVHLATAMQEIGLPVIAVGLITEPEQAEAIIAGGAADAIAMARAFLWNPRWPWHAAAVLGAEVEAPKQYWRSAPAGTKPPFGGFRHGQR